MKKILLFLLIISLNYTFCQEMYNVTYDYTDNNGYVCKSILFTDNKEAVFKILDKRESGEINSETGGVGFIYNDKLSKSFYADKYNSFYRFILFDKEIIYKDEYQNKINWVIDTKIKKKIGKYNCTLAKININGRSYTVWFTFEVPIKFGPLKLHNLPGLIIEVTEDNGFLKISLNNYVKTKDLTEFNNSKQFYLDKKNIINYNEYELNIVNIETTGRLRQLAYIKENNYEGVSLSDDIALERYLEIPKTLLFELNKLH